MSSSSLFDLAKDEILKLAARLLADRLQLPPETVERVIRYLLRFGHLSPAKVLTALVNHAVLEEEFRAGVRSLQEFAGLPTTGEVSPLLERLLGYRRCGCPDVLAVGVAAAKWRKRDLTYAVESYVSTLPEQEQRDLLQLAWDQWSAVCGLRARPATGKPDIIISTGRGPAQQFDGSLGVLAWAQLPPGDDRQLLMRFDLDEVWVRESARPGILYLNVACHEIGHLLGLEHSRRPAALMAPIYAPGVSRPQMDDDIPRAQVLYGASASPPPAPPVPVPPAGKSRLVLESDSPIRVVA